MSEAQQTLEYLGSHSRLHETLTQSTLPRTPAAPTKAPSDAAVPRAATVKSRAWKSPRWWTAGAFMVVPTPLLIALFFHQAEPIARLVLACSSLIAGLIAAWFWQHDLIVHNRRNLTAAILMTSGLVIATAIIWNQSYLSFAQTVSRREVFRHTLQRPFTPAYGIPQETTFHRAWPAIAVGVAAAALVMRTRADLPMTAVRVATIVGLQLGEIFAFAATEGHSRIAGHAWELLPFRADAARFAGPLDLLANYVQRMPTLSWFGRHYPPGSALLWMAQLKMNSAFPLVYYTIAAAAAAAVIPIYFAARELAPHRPRVHYFAALAYATSTGPLIFASLSTTPLVLLPAALALWALLRGSRRGGIGPGAVLGISVLLFAFISLSVAFFITVLAAAAAGCLMFNLRPRRNVVKTLAVSILVTAAGAALFRAASGFSFVNCVRASIAAHHEQAATNGFDGGGAYFMRSTGNLLAFVLSNLPLTGVCMAALLLRRRNDWRLPQNLMLPPVVAAVHVAAFSGAFFFETERIWLFFIPPLALAAAVELGRYNDRRTGFDARLAIVMMIVFAVTQELSFTHYR